MITVPRPRAATKAWDRHFGQALPQLRADILVAVMGELDSPTVRDLLAHVGDELEAYDPEEPDRVEVLLGEVCGRPGSGPTVAEFVSAMGVLGVTEAVLEQRLGDIVDRWTP